MIEWGQSEASWRIGQTQSSEKFVRMSEAIERMRIN
jgi:hypothetical protein